MEYIIAGILLVIGISIACIATFGIFKFKYVLNRMHAAAMCDTLALMICLLGVSVLYGISYITLKLILIIIFLIEQTNVCTHKVLCPDFYSHTYNQESWVETVA